MSAERLRSVVRDQFGAELRSLDMLDILRRTCVPELLALMHSGQLNTQYIVELSRLPTEAQRELVALGPETCRGVAKELRALRIVCPTCGSRSGEHERDILERRLEQLDEVARTDQVAAVRAADNYVAASQDRRYIPTTIPQRNGNHDHS